MNPPSAGRAIPFSYKVPSSDNEFAFSAPRPCDQYQSERSAGQVGDDSERDVAEHDHQRPRRTRCAPCRAHGLRSSRRGRSTDKRGRRRHDDAGRGGFRQLEAALGNRVIEVVTQDREHPVKREPFPQFDSRRGWPSRSGVRTACVSRSTRLPHSCHVGPALPRAHACGGGVSVASQVSSAVVWSARAKRPDED